MAGKAEIELRLKDEATRAYNQFVNNFKKGGTDIGDVVKGLGTTLGAVFSFAAAKDFIAKANDAQQQVAKLDQALINTGNATAATKKEMLEYSEALGKKTAIDDDDITALQAKALAMTGNVQAAQQLTKATLDLAEGMGINAESAITMLAKTEDGKEGLSRLGITIGKTTSESERLAKITQEVEKRFGGMAEAAALTDAGKIKSISIAMEDLQEKAGALLMDLLRPNLPIIEKGFTAISWVIDKIVGSLKVGVAAIMTGLVTPLAAVEAKLNSMGISQSHMMQNFLNTGARLTKTYAEELVNGAKEAEIAVNGVARAIGETNKESEGFTLTKKKINELEQSLSTLEIGSKQWINTTLELHRIQKEYNKELKNAELQITKIEQHWSDPKAVKIFATAMSKTGEDYKKTLKAMEIDTSKWQVKTEEILDGVVAKFEEQQNTVRVFTTSISNAIVESWKTTFAGSEAAGKTFLKNILNAFLTAAQGILAANLAVAMAKAIPSFGATLVADMALYGLGIGAIEIAKAAVARMHTGGIVGPRGTVMPLKSNEHPFILEEGEEVLPKGSAQGKTIIDQSTKNVVENVNININGNSMSVESVKKAVEEGMRRTGLVVEQYFVNTNKGMRQPKNISLAYI